MSQPVLRIRDVHPDPGSGFSPIPDPGSRIPDPTKKEEVKFFIFYLLNFLPMKYWYELGAHDLRVYDLREYNLREYNLREYDLREYDLCEYDLCEYDLCEYDLREYDPWIRDPK